MDDDKSLNEIMQDMMNAWDAFEDAVKEMVAA